MSYMQTHAHTRRTHSHTPTHTHAYKHERARTHTYIHTIDVSILSHDILMCILICMHTHKLPITQFKHSQAQSDDTSWPTQVPQKSETDEQQDDYVLHNPHVSYAWRDSCMCATR